MLWRERKQEGIATWAVPKSGWKLIETEKVHAWNQGYNLL